MNEINKFIDGLGPSKYYYVGIAVLFVAYLIGMVFYMRIRKNRGKRYEEENPTCSKMYVKSKERVVVSGTLSVNSVDGQTPIYFIEGVKSGVYLLPGTHVLEAYFTTTRPGVVWRSVTTTYGPMKVEIEVGRRKTYELSFDKANETCVFTELRES